MKSDVQLVVCGILPLTANGALTLYKEPPFRVLTPGWAALATLDLERDVPHIAQVFDFMAEHPNESSPVIIGQKSRWITGDAYCLFREPIHRGGRYTLAWPKFDWSTPCRLGFVDRKFAA